MVRMSFTSAVWLVAAAGADPVIPFEWDTLGGRLYSFCSNQSGKDINETRKLADGC